MRDFINIINEGAKIGPFTLAPGLDPNNYQITDSFKQFKSWKCMTYVGEGNVKKGEMGPVGYVWISTVDNSIIPISRGDEHHTGGDMVGQMNQLGKWSINRKQYIPVWGYGHNYIYYEEEIPLWINVLQKFLAWGGPDGIMDGANSLRDISMTLSQFANSGGDIKLKPGQLAPLGQMFFDLYTELSRTIVEARSATTRAGAAKPFQVAVTLTAFLAKNSMTLDIEPAILKALPGQIRTLAKETDLEGLMALFFNFGQIKQKVHHGLRTYDPKDVWSGPKLKAFWGDVPLAAHMLADL